MNEIWISGITGHCLEIRRSALPGMYSAGKMGRSYPVHEIYMSSLSTNAETIITFSKSSVHLENGRFVVTMVLEKSFDGG